MDFASLQSILHSGVIHPWGGKPTGGYGHEGGFPHSNQESYYQHWREIGQKDSELSGQRDKYIEGRPGSGTIEILHCSSKAWCTKKFIYDNDLWRHLIIQTETWRKRDAKDSPPSQEKRITILRPDLRAGEQKGNLPEAAPSPVKRSAVEATKDAVTIPEKRNAAKAAENAQSLLEQGKSQLNDGEFAAAVGIFTLILSTNPQDSLVYRLRGDAYDNLGDQQKAIEDWTQAARLGDTTIQSYLDSQGVKWRENPTP